VLANDFISDPQINGKFDHVRFPAVGLDVLAETRASDGVVLEFVKFRHGIAIRQPKL
jgi:hypothetical protein